MSEYDDAPESPFGLTMKETDAGELRLMFEPDDFRFKIDATGLPAETTKLNALPAASASGNGSPSSRNIV